MKKQGTGMINHSPGEAGLGFKGGRGDGEKKREKTAWVLFLQSL